MTTLFSSVTVTPRLPSASSTRPPWWQSTSTCSKTNRTCLEVASHSRSVSMGAFVLLFNCVLLLPTIWYSYCFYEIVFYWQLYDMYIAFCETVCFYWQLYLSYEIVCFLLATIILWYVYCLYLIVHLYRQLYSMFRNRPVMRTVCLTNISDAQKCRKIILTPQNV